MQRSIQSTSALSRRARSSRRVLILPSWPGLPRLSKSTYTPGYQASIGACCLPREGDERGEGEGAQENADGDGGGAERGGGDVEEVDAGRLRPGAVLIEWG